MTSGSWELSYPPAQAVVCVEDHERQARYDLSAQRRGSSAELRLKGFWPNPAAASAHFKSVVLPWCKAMWLAGHPLEIEVRTHEDAKTDRQRNYYHGVVLTQITLQARPNGEQFPFKVWKEHFRETFLGFKTVTFKNPITGKKSRRRVRVSTEDLGVRGYSTLIEKVTAFAAMELNVRFPMTWGEYEHMQIDPETGEVA
ncbi:MAG: hypothetical protein ABFD89_23670 [Bryobacteraceae bacterium]